MAMKPEATASDRSRGDGSGQGGGELAQRTARNSLYGLLGFVAPTVIAIATTPVIIHYLGIRDFGILALTSVFAGFVGLLDFGMAPTLLKFVAEYVTTDEHERVGKVISASLLFYLLVASIGAVAAFLTAEFLLTPLFHINPSEMGAARFAFFAAGFNLFFGMILNPLSSLPASVQRFDLTASLMILLQVVSAVLTIIVLILGWGLRGAAAVSAATPALGVVLFTVVSARIVPGFRLVPSVDLSTLRQMFSFSNYAFLSNIAGVILFQIDKVLLAALGNIAAVTFYTVPSNVARRIHGSVASLTAIVLPVSSGLFALDDKARVHALYARATRFVLLFIISISVPLIVLAEPIFRYWLGGKFAAESSNVLRILVLTYGMLALTAIPYYIALGAGRPKPPAVFNGIGAALNVSLVAALIPPFGAIGAASGYLISTITVPAFVWYVERRVIRVHGSEWPKTLVKLGAAAAVQALVCLALREVIGDAWTLVGVLVVSMPVAAATGYLLGFFDHEDKQLIAQILRSRAPDRTADAS
jgi:O-antigen/teichoic acid export membrane protein